MFKHAVDMIKPVSENQIQAFYTDKFQLFDIIEVILSQLSKCSEIVITSFSISEEFLRKIYRFREKYQPEKMILFLDTKAAAKVQKLNLFLKNSFDEIWLTNNHGKVVLFNSSSLVSICTSQNQTRGNRKESHIITTCNDVFMSFYDSVNEMKKTAIQL